MKNTAGKFILKNFVKMVLLIFAVSIAAFALMTVSPVDPLQANVGQAALGSMSQEQIAKLEEYWGVGEPPVQRYLAWLKDFLKGDMGVSLLYRQDVAKVIAVKLGNSLFLMIIAWVLSGLIGFALGALAGMNRGKFVDKAVKGYCLLISSTPAFWIAMLLLIIFGVWLKILPIGLSVPIGVEASGVTFLDRYIMPFFRRLRCPLPELPILPCIPEKKWSISVKVIMLFLQEQEVKACGRFSGIMDFEMFWRRP